MRSAKFYMLAVAISLLAGDALAFKTLVIINNNGKGEYTGQFKLLSSSPYDRQVFIIPPNNITLTFSNPLKADKSTLKVYDSVGNQLEVGDMEVEGTHLSITLPELSAGKYNVKWRARCQCESDDSIGDNFHFSVK